MNLSKAPPVVNEQITVREGSRPTAGQRRRRGWDQHGIWYLFLAPAVLLLLMFMAYPLVESLRLGFFRWNGLKPPRFVGVENFVELAQDRFFWGSLWHTLVFAAVATVGTVAIGFLLAVAISHRVWGWPLFRVGYFLPTMLSLTVAGALWWRIYEFNYGLLNTLLRNIGLEIFALPWLADVRYSLRAIIIVTIWQYAGFPMIVLLAAIENIPQELHDAATIDGANEGQRIWHLTLPLIRPVLASISMLQVVFSLKVFDVIWVMTKGGPSESSSVLGTYLYRHGFELRAFGYASSVAVVMFVIIFALTYLYQWLVKFEAVEF